MYGLPPEWGVHIKETHRLFNENHQIQFATLGNGRLHWFQLDTPLVPETIDIAQMEMLMKVQYPEKYGNARLIFVTPEADIVKPHMKLITEEAPPLLIIPDYPCGGRHSTPNDYLTAAKNLYPQMQGRIEMKQLKLLLRGEQGLLQKCMRLSTSSTKARDLIWETAAKYQMGPAPATRIGQERHSKQRKEPPDRRQQSSSIGSAPQAKQASAQEQPSSKTLTLQEGQWSVPVMHSFSLGQAGVYLETDSSVAQIHARQLLNSKHVVGLLTIAPIGVHASVEKLTFILQEQQSGMPSREKVVTGYLQSYGPKRVEYKGKIFTAERASAPPTTQVLALYTRKTAIEDKQWKELHEISSVPALKKQLNQYLPEAKLEDVFRIKQEGESYSCLVRIPREQAQMWMQAKTLPFTASPLGNDAQDFKVLWDRECKKLGAVVEEYSSLDEYRGAVLTQKGIGARFSKEQADAAKAQSGIPMGDSFLILGVPHDMREPELQTVMQEMQWQCTILPQTRRVRQRRAQYVIKAQTPPPQAILRLKTGSEVTTLQILPHKPKQDQPRTVAPQTAPTTWVQVAQRALGRQQEANEHDALQQAGNIHEKTEKTGARSLRDLTLQQGWRNRRTTMAWKRTRLMMLTLSSLLLSLEKPRPD